MLGFTDNTEAKIVPFCPLPPIAADGVAQLTDAPEAATILQQAGVAVNGGNEAIEMEVLLGGWKGVVFLDSSDGTGVGRIIQNDTPRVDV